ncbi:hypothetical protein ACQYWQ_10765 [Streptomyces sp. P6-2-1]|uniref:hypothetical protein n=1 Tax=unclassified Streptomyces TaxID=2593676 RepID=UPI003D35BC90
MSTPPPGPEDSSPYAKGPGGAPQWGPPPSYGYPQQPPAPGGAPYFGGPAPLIAIGDILVTQTEIATPAGTMPLKGSVWNVADLSRTEEKISQAGIILAIIFGVLFCGLGLLFLLMKERTTSGFIQVTVTSAGHHHSTMLPALGPWSFPQVMQQVNYARSLSV